jgi:hypothetical protein
VSISRVFLASVLASAMVAASGAVAASDVEPNTSSKPDSINLKEDLTDANPAAFARRLGELLGVEVRLPVKGFRTLTVPAGEWTPSRLLNHVARQIEEASWQQVFELPTRVNGRPAAPPPASKLPVTGKITLTLDDVSFPRVIGKVEEGAPCVIRLPDGTPPGRFRVTWHDAPLDRVLADLAAAGGLRVQQVVVFQRAEDAQADACRDEEDRQFRETQQQAEIGSRLQELYGADPTSEEFPWDNVDRDALSRSLGRELDMDPPMVDTLMERLRLEGLTQRSE